MIQRIILAGLAVALLLAGPAQAKKPDAAYFQNQFDHYSKVIAELKAVDTTGACPHDIEAIRTWISQGQAYLANDKLDKIEPFLKRIGAQAEYVRAKVNRIQAESAAQEAEAKAAAAEQQLAEARAAHQAANPRMQALEAQGL